MKKVFVWLMAIAMMCSFCSCSSGNTGEETNPVETKSVETEPVETKPVETEPVETKPVEIPLTLENVEDYLLIETNLEECNISDLGNKKYDGTAILAVTSRSLVNCEYKNVKITVELMTDQVFDWNYYWGFGGKGDTTFVRENDDSSTGFTFTGYYDIDLRVSFDGTADKNLSMAAYVPWNTIITSCDPPEVTFTIVAVSGTVIQK